MTRTATLLIVGLLLAAPAFAQPDRTTGDARDVIWARDIGSATITVDGTLSEEVWQQAETYPIVWNGDHPLPGGGQWIEENPAALDNPLDPPAGTAYFLRKGNELYLAFEIEDESIGGTRSLFRHDGILMQLVNATDQPDDYTAFDRYSSDGTGAGVREEMFYGWFHPNAADTSATGLAPAGIGPRAWSSDFGLTFGDSADATPRSPEAWEYAATVDGVSNDDYNGGSTFTADNGYIMEMRIRLDSLGWDLTEPMSRMPFTFAVEDQDYRWPTNADTYTNVRAYFQWRYLNGYSTGVGFIAGDPSVTVTSGETPAYTDPEFSIPTAVNAPEPTIDGQLDEPAWDGVDPQFTLKYQMSNAERDAGLPGVLSPIYTFYWHPDANPVLDPTAGTFKMFYRNGKLYVGLDTDDAAVNGVEAEDKRDGFRIAISSLDSLRSGLGGALAPIQFDFSIDSTGAVRLGNYAAALDTLDGGAYKVDAAAFMKVGLTGEASTPGNAEDIDAGYQMEVAIDLAALGYPANLDSEPIWLSLNYFDGDSLPTDADSYGTRTWTCGERNTCVLYGYFDENSFVTAGEASPSDVGGLRVTGSYPNPTTGIATLRYELPTAGAVTVEVFDVLGRQVQTVRTGLQAEGAQRVQLDASGLSAGAYVVRVRMDDGTSATGRMLVTR